MQTLSPRESLARETSWMPCPTYYNTILPPHFSLQVLYHSPGSLLLRWKHGERPCVEREEHSVHYLDSTSFYPKTVSSIKSRSMNGM